MFVTNISSGIQYEYSSINNYQYIPDNPEVNINQGIKTFPTSDGATNPQGILTVVPFTLNRRLHAPVYLYYGLKKVYQNYRTFNNGRSPSQLYGHPQKKWGSSLKKCEPFKSPGSLGGSGNLSIEIFPESSSSSTAMSRNETEKNPRNRNTTEDNALMRASTSKTVAIMARDFTYNPCGAFPWAKFNDTFTLIKLNSESSDLDAGGTLICKTEAFDAVGNPIPLDPSSAFALHSPLRNVSQPLNKSTNTLINNCRKKGISFRADAEVLYGKLQTGERIWSLRYPFTTSNDYLRNGWYLNEPGHSLPDPEDFDLQVWMHTALLPKFTKLFRIIEVDLEPGTYEMRIEEFYDVTSFKGAKFFELQEARSASRGTKSFAVVFVILGITSFVIGLAFVFEQVSCRLGLGMKNLDALREPKRSWYAFDPSSPYFEAYNTLRMCRYVPMDELEDLRKKQSA